MPEVLLVKAIKPKKLRTQPFRREIQKALKAEAEKLKREFRKTTKTWRRKPKFTQLAPVRGVEHTGEAAVLVGTDDPIYRYLDQGTRIRWAVMSRDWQSKTSPRMIGSRPGRGRVVIAGKRAMLKRGIRPRPGIKAREFAKTIQKLRERPFKRRMEQAMKRAAEQVFQ